MTSVLTYVYRDLKTSVWDEYVQTWSEGCGRLLIVTLGVWSTWGREDKGLTKEDVTRTRLPTKQSEREEVSGSLGGWLRVQVRE